VEVNGIQARVRNGVLSVRIPKKEDVKARRIQVTG
jgi:HSP20 family molecular chaperone IbpA